MRSKTDRAREEPAAYATKARPRAEAKRALWEQIEREIESGFPGLGLTPAQKVELARRIRKHRAHPEPLIPMEETLAKLKPPK